MHLRISFQRLLSSLVLIALGPASALAQQASGSVTVQTLGAITATHAVAFEVRDSRNARSRAVEVLLSDVVVDATPFRAALDPHMLAINAEPLKDRNYILLWVRPDGHVSMNATFSKTMTQFLNDSAGGLLTTWTTNTPTRVEGRVYSAAPLKTMDGTTYTVDLKFAVDIPKAAAGTPLPAGGGEAGKALSAFIAAATRKNWAAIKAGSSPDALKMFDKDYNTPAENAANVLDLLKVWIPTTKMTITGGELSGNAAVLDVEGELFPGMRGLSRVRMVKTGATWQFDQAAHAGSVR